MTNPISDLKEINKLNQCETNSNIFSVYSLNGLTIQELLCQFFTKINECVNVSNKSIDMSKWLVNEGLNQEVVKKLNLWLGDGTIENVINKEIFSNITSQINSNKNDINIVKKTREPKLHILPHPRSDENSLCIVIEHSNGEFSMIDCGERDNFTWYEVLIDKLNVDKLKYLFITHSHTDHIGNASEIIDKYKPEFLVCKSIIWSRLPEIEVTWQTELFHNKMIESAKRNNVTILEAEDKEYIINENEKIKCYGANFIDYSNYNNMCVCYLYSYKDNKIMVAGDATFETEKYILSSYNLPKVDALVVGHHGYEGSTSLEWVSRLKPKIGICGNIDWLRYVGNNNRMGKVFERLLYYYVDVYDTKGINEGLSLNCNGSVVTNNGNKFHLGQLWLTPNDSESNRQVYFKNDGTIARDEITSYYSRYCAFKGWDLVVDDWYEFDKDKNFVRSDTSGYLIQNDWYNDGDNWYYFKANCVMGRNERIKIQGKWYSFADNGVCENPEGDIE